MLNNINKKFNKLYLIVLGLFMGATTLIPLKVDAWSVSSLWKGLFGFIKNIVLYVAAYLLLLFVKIATYIFYFTGKFFNFMFNEGIDITNLTVVNAGWGITRDVLNMFFIIAILAIAFATILRIESYQYKVLLPKLVYAALLVNFSRTIAVVLIDFSNILMKTLLNLSPGGSISETFARTIFGTGALSIDKGVNMPGFTSDHLDTLCMGLFMLLVLILGMSFAILALGLLMLIRGLVLVVLIILSPAAFVLNILPITKQHAQRWWDEFLKYVFYGPVAAFLIYMAVMLALNLKNEVTVPAEKFIQGNDFGASINMLTASNITSIIVVMTFLYMAVMVIQSLSPMAAGIATGLYKRGGRLAGGVAGWGARKSWDYAKKQASRSLAKGAKGVPGSLVGAFTGGANAFAQLAFGKRATKDGQAISARSRMSKGFSTGFKAGDIVSMLDPKTGKAAWDELQADKDKKIYGKSGAKAKNMLRGIVDKNDKTDYEQKHEDGLISEAEKSIKDANPALNTDMLINQAVEAEPGSAEQKAAIKLLAQTGALEDVIDRILNTSEGPGRDKLMKTFMGDKYKGMPSEKLGLVTAEMKFDMLEHGLGKDRALREAPNIAAALKQKGNHSMGTGTKFDISTGKMRFLTQAEISNQFENSFEKMTGDEQLKVKLASYTDKQFVQNDAGKFVPQPNINEGNFSAMLKAGFSGEPERVIRMMAEKERKFLSGADVQKKFEVLNPDVKDEGKKVRNERMMKAVQSSLSNQSSSQASAPTPIVPGASERKPIRKAKKKQRMNTR